MTAAEGPDVWAERIYGYTASKSGGICVELTGDNLVGMIGIGRGHWPKTQQFGTILGVYVNHDWRGHHITVQMLNRCIDWAKKNGIRVIKLGLTYPTSPPSALIHVAGSPCMALNHGRYSITVIITMSC